MHLSLEDARELALGYCSEKLLSDKQLEYKKHMAKCDVCYEKFCAEYVIQKTLLSRGLIQFSTIEELLVSNEKSKSDIVNKIKCILVNEADGLKKVVQEKTKQVSSLWNFYPVSQPAISRGQKVLYESQIMENEVSDYSYIEKTAEGILFRLDETDFTIQNLQLVYITEDASISFPFVYNEKNRSYDVMIKGEIPIGAKFQIVEVLNEDK